MKTCPRPPKAALQVPSSTTKPPTFPGNTQKKREREETRFANGDVIPEMFVIRIRSLDLVPLEIEVTQTLPDTESSLIETGIPESATNIYHAEI